MIEPQTIARTPNPECPACIARTVHTSGQRTEFHPMMGHGYTPEMGWTHPQIGPLPIQFCQVPVRK